MAKIREKDPEEAENYREKESVKKRKQRHTNNVVEEAGIKKLDPTNEKKEK